MSIYNTNMTKNEKDDKIAPAIHRPSRPKSARPSSAYQRPNTLTLAIPDTLKDEQTEISSPISPTSIVQGPIEDPIRKQFESVLYAQIAKKLLKQQGLKQLDVDTDEEIHHIAQEITQSIAEFRALLEQNPTIYCRSANNVTLWTEKRHQAIKALQKKIKPYFDRVNQILAGPEVESRSNKQLYSSPIGRKQASIHGPILETTPFGKILESSSIHTMLKRCFGPNAFSSKASTQLYKEIDGEIVERGNNPAQYLSNSHSVSFKTDVDTAVVIGVWEAISSSYAEEETDEAHIYVPFGIGTNSVVWNHELPELRKKYSDDHIIIHTLSSPESYQALKRVYDEANAELCNANANPNMPSEIIFSLRMNREEAQKNMDNYLNEANNWEQAPINKSKVELVTRTKGVIPLQQIKEKVRELRNKKEVNSAKNDANDPTGPTEEHSSGFNNLD